MLKYSLDTKMINDKIEIVVYQDQPSKYTVCLNEANSYNNDNNYNFEVTETFTTKQDATTFQSKVFDYMIKKGFEKLNKRYVRLC